MFYRDFFEALSQHRVRYVLAGGLAMNLHGVPRMTMDIDIVVSLDPDNVHRLVAAVSALGLSPVLPIEIADLADAAKRDDWVLHRNMIAFALHGPDPSSPTVDILIGVDLEFEWAYARRVVRDLEGVAISVASIDDMIALKTVAGRAQDRADIEQLMKLKDAP